MKKYVLFGFLFGLFLGGIFFATRVFATQTPQTHREWSNWSQWSEWSDCRSKEDTDRKCGDSEEGVQVRTRTRTCISKPGQGQNQCSPLGDTDSQKQERECEIKLPPCVVDVCPNIEGVQETLPEGYQFNSDKQCIKDEEPIPTPSPEPTTPPAEEHRDSGGGGGSASAPVCSDQTPGDVANIFVDSGKPNDGKVEVRWWNPERADKVHIRYEEYSQSNWPYSLLNTENDGHQEIGNLKNGVNYRFEVAGVNGCAVGNWSQSFDPKP